MKRILLLLVIGLSLQSAKAITVKDTIVLEKFSAITMERELFRQVNAFRVANGKKKLIFNSSLHKAASDHSVYLQYKNELTHEQDNLKSKTVSDRIKKYIKAGRFAAGENLARTIVLRPSKNTLADGSKMLSTAFTYEQAATFMFNAWKHSTVHKQNMLNEKFTISAISIDADADKKRLTAVQVFAHFY